MSEYLETCTSVPCGDPESQLPPYDYHCYNDSCPNFHDSCPAHKDSRPVQIMTDIAAHLPLITVLAIAVLVVYILITLTVSR